MKDPIHMAEKAVELSHYDFSYFNVSQLLDENLQEARLH